MFIALAADAVGDQYATIVGCMDHARRGFTDEAIFESLRTEKKEQAVILINDSTRTWWIAGMVFLLPPMVWWVNIPVVAYLSLWCSFVAVVITAEKDRSDILHRRGKYTCLK